MVIPTYLSVRGVFVTSILLIGIGIYIIVNNSKPKEDYQQTTGVIEFLEKKFGELPKRHEGEFRYLKVNSYPYVFEIYEPNSEKTSKTIDDLKVGDTVEVYYYERSSVEESGINKFAQFIDHDGKPYFIRNGFQKQIGYALIGLVVALNILTLVLWKKGKFAW